MRGSRSLSCRRRVTDRLMRVTSSSTAASSRVAPSRSAMSRHRRIDAGLSSLAPANGSVLGAPGDSSITRSRGRRLCRVPSPRKRSDAVRSGVVTATPPTSSTSSSSSRDWWVCHSGAPEALPRRKTSDISTSRAGAAPPRWTQAADSPHIVELAETLFGSSRLAACARRRGFRPSYTGA